MTSPLGYGLASYRRPATWPESTVSSPPRGVVASRKELPQLIASTPSTVWVNLVAAAVSEASHDGSLAQLHRKSEGGFNATLCHIDRSAFGWRF